MRTMYPTLFLVPAGFFLATILLTIVPFISATPSSQLKSVVRRQENGIPDGWFNKACYSDNASLPTLTSKSYQDLAGMTVANCVNFCNNNGNCFAGLENGTYCHCGNVTSASSEAIELENCDVACSGNLTDICGGNNSITLMWNGVINWEPNFVDDVVNWTMLGCYNDTEKERTLNVSMAIPGGLFNNTVEGCIQSCGAENYIMAGLELSNECWCGNDTSPISGQIDDTECQLACSGNSSAYCGGFFSMLIYNETGPYPDDGFGDGGFSSNP